MFTSFVIKNFRGFSSLTFSPLERVNLITGVNNVGKTALLEALFLHVGANNPELSLRVSAIRGIERFPIQAEGLWGWLFFDKHVTQAIELISVDHNDLKRTLTIRLTEPETPQVIAPVNGGTATRQASGSLTTASALDELSLEYIDSSGKRSQVRASITPEGDLKAQRTQMAPIPPGVYLSTRARLPREDAERFSNLERTGRHENILPTLRLLEPRLKRLAVLVTGGAPMVHGDIGIGELIPLPLMGEGTVRLFSLLLAIANAPGGIVLVDEIENGLHHSVMTGVFAALAQAARELDVQVFATTHSWECVRAAHQAFSESNTYDFRLHRLERVQDGIRDVAYDQKMLGMAIEHGLEVR